MSDEALERAKREVLATAFGLWACAHEDPPERVQVVGPTAAGEPTRAWRCPACKRLAFQGASLYALRGALAVVKSCAGDGFEAERALASLVRTMEGT